ncbi:hypothetical protein PIB19_09675 [Sphingomonas sp. 7/4-4]|uniref:hypothetical protein n=1 Tax=Sphingomonas sp. 7/4-4 TaxID=3018446 RepID=UPI0022F3997D|nr:hypothetical protein [Sphingomonas sp. 7/4-4]WBY09536.1 hypothetical protein PIB19_09675 [Sphingomonas sp. 7/4-4]
MRDAGKRRSSRPPRSRQPLGGVQQPGACRRCEQQEQFDQFGLAEFARQSPAPARVLQRASECAQRGIGPKHQHGSRLAGNVLRKLFLDRFRHFCLIDPPFGREAVEQAAQRRLLGEARQREQLP